MGDVNHNNHVDANEAIFQFPINNPIDDTRLKFIPPIVISIFLGHPHEEPNLFLFEFDVMCRTYDYTMDAHKI